MRKTFAASCLYKIQLIRIIQFLLAQLVNMALRVDDPDAGKMTNENSAVAGLALYWNDHHQKPSV